MAQFTNQDTAAAYEPAVSTNPVVTVIGLYAGPLSGIPLAAAQKLHESGSNLLKPVEAKRPAAAPAKDLVKK